MGEGPSLRVAPGRLLAVGAASAVVLAVLHLLVAVLYYVWSPQIGWLYDLAALVDLTVDDSIGTWWSAAVLALCALLAAAAAQADPPWRRHWYGFAVLLGLLSVDEVARGHERAGALVGEVVGRLSGPFLYAWVLLAGPVLLVLALLSARFVRALPRPDRVRLLTAVGVLVAGGVLVEMGNAALESARGTAGDLPYALGTLVEESLEMAGALLLLRALLLRVGPLGLTVAAAPPPTTRSTP